MEEAEPDVMQRKPRKTEDGIFSGGLGIDVAYQGVLVALLTIIAYYIGNYFEFFGTAQWCGYFNVPGGVSSHGMTMAFLTMSMCEVFHSFNMRSQRKSVFSLPKQNKMLFGAMLGSLILTFVVLEIPFLANAFGFTPIGMREYLTALGLAVSIIPIVEIVKFVQRKIKK